MGVYLIIDLMVKVYTYLIKVIVMKEKSKMVLNMVMVDTIILMEIAMMVFG